MTLEKSKAHQQWYKAMFLLPTILKLNINAYTILDRKSNIENKA